MTKTKKLTKPRKIAHHFKFIRCLTHEYIIPKFGCMMFDDNFAISFSTEKREND